MRSQDGGTADPVCRELSLQSPETDGEAPGGTGQACGQVQLEVQVQVQVVVVVVEAWLSQGGGRAMRGR